MLQKKIKISSLKNNFLNLIAFTIPLSKNLLPILIITTLILAIFEGDLARKAKHYKNLLFLLLPLLYLLYIAGMIHTQHIDTGFFDLQQKLVFVVFPLIWFAHNFDKEEFLSNLLMSFIWGCVAACIICLFNAAYSYYLSENNDVFFYTKFSVIFHPSYFALYLCFALILLLFRNNLITSQWFLYALQLFFIFMIILTQSKSGILSLIIILAYKLGYTLFYLKNLKKSLSFFFFTLFFVGVFFVFFPQSLNRIFQLEQTMYNKNKEINSTKSRLIVWQDALHVFKQHFFVGVGTGDVKDALIQEYLKKGEHEVAQKHLNAHNQFLQTAVAIGITGLMWLFLIFYILISKSIKNHQAFIFLFAVICVINLLFESMFETQAGIVFVTFFSSLFLALFQKRSFYF